MLHQPELFSPFIEFNNDYDCNYYRYNYCWGLAEERRVVCYNKKPEKLSVYYRFYLLPAPPRSDSINNIKNDEGMNGYHQRGMIFASEV